MNKIIIFLIGLLISLSLSAFIIVNSWKVDANYTIKFSGSKVAGTFSGLKGAIFFSATDLQNSKMDVEVDVNTINTGDKKMDEHAKNDSWFDVAKYPKITFKSTSIVKETSGYLVKGFLELHGVKKEISIPFQFVEHNSTGVFTGVFTIKRKNYGINGNFFGFMVGDDFVIDLKIPVKQ